jgi:DNA-binding transcriptional LysR family regulator
VGLIEIVSEDSGVERHGAGSDELRVIVSPQHPLAGAIALSAAQLAAHPFIHREPGNAIRDLADQFFISGGVPLEDLNIAAELGSLSTVKQFVADGFGFAFASVAAIRREVAIGQLVAVPLLPRLSTPLEVIVLKDKFRSRLVNTFAEFVSAEIGRLASPEL